ncbi:MAG: DUF1292 domain-containing protein [Clostridiaceae bacterium]|jgi:hypothetical protein|nr:DUF1292 domain-containing protein [Clostridiaceae bacterium]
MRSKTKPGPGSLDRDNARSDDSVLAVLMDERSGREYYVSFLDSFVLDGQAYSVMYNYQPGLRLSQKPEIVMMRTWKNESGEQLFSSIKSRKELNRVFDFFYKRYATSLLQ